MGSRADEAAWLYSFSTIIGGFGSIMIGGISERLTARTTLLGVVVALMLSSIILWHSTSIVDGFKIWIWMIYLTRGRLCGLSRLGGCQWGGSCSNSP